ncbi:50S ribosomal protein L25 [Aerococcus urinaeequi]|uniref:Large ribosomal subunit protein bL25 n=1 Tax=Aerococcus viridans TaxID=1377 RepID=A0A2N6UDT6_9LACT|nr:MULTISPECIES: 50S ribosomal protein L25 [Aerococcus]OFU52180.1 50S ribosomal protein L25 [Aerococcus sp. HMSC10H05]PMC79695.1 50S ribosomal protein L25 [Aerococcus viridans]
MKFTAQKRDGSGTSAAKQLRKENLVPGVVYASDLDPINISMSVSDVEQIRRELGLNSVFDLELDGETRTVYVREISQSALKPTIYNISLQAIKKGQKLEMPLSIVVVNEDALADKEGVASTTTLEIDVIADPATAPDSVEVDVTGLAIGDSVTAGELNLASDIELVTDAEEVIVAISAPVEEPEEVDPDAEVAEPEVIDEKEGKIVEDTEN